MSSLKKKLSRLGGAGPGSVGGFGSSGMRRDQKLDALRSAIRGIEDREEDPSEDLEAGASALGSLLSQRASRPVLPPSGKKLPGKNEESEHGTLRVVESWIGPIDTHGRIRASLALEAAPKVVASLSIDPRFSETDVRGALYIDTETTGLSTSAGTVAFLIGYAYFEDESLCVRQLLLPALGAERPMLHDLAKRIREATMVVSYNGKSFDWPLLRTRFLMNRVPTPPLPPHLDLLHCSRRVFKRRMDSVRLVDMERELLGFVREHDISGAEIPEEFLRFAKSGDPGRLDEVIEHNGHDLVALAAILGELARRFEEVRREDDPLDHLSFAKVAERAKDHERAMAFAEAAAQGGADADATFEAWMIAARTARREKVLEAEHRALCGALHIAGRTSISELYLATAHLELSKHYEHRRKSLGLALIHAEETVAVEEEEGCEKRCARLRRRLERLERLRRQTKL